jgi:hypothetical protein
VSMKDKRYSVRALGKDFATILSKVVDALNDHEERIQALEHQNQKKSNAQDE